MDYEGDDISHTLCAPFRQYPGKAEGVSSDFNPAGTAVDASQSITHYDQELSSVSLSYKGVGYIDKSKVIIADCVLSMLKLCIVNRMFKNTKGRVPSEQRKRKKIQLGLDYCQRNLKTDSLSRQRDGIVVSNN